MEVKNHGTQQSSFLVSSFDFYNQERVLRAMTAVGVTGLFQYLMITTPQKERSLGP